MVVTLLPASAAAFAPRTAPTIVLHSRIETWLTQTLKRVNRVKRPLNSVPQHFRCLTETLSGASSIWTLASMMLPKAPEADLRRDSNLLVEALFNYQMLHVEAYVVHVDMVSQHEVAFKLTQETIDSLVEYHKDVYSVDAAATTHSWPDKELQVKQLHEDFIQAINKYVYRTDVRALEGLEEDGAGELLEGRSNEVKSSLNSLFLPLLPPPPRIVDVVAPPPVSYMPAQWWAPQQLSPVQHLPAPVDPWRVLGSTSSPSISAGESISSPWSPSINATSLPSPAQPYIQPHSSSAHFYSSPPVMAPLPALPLPSVIAQQCGTVAGTNWGNNFAWSYNDFMPQYQIHI